MDWEKLEKKELVSPYTPGDATEAERKAPRSGSEDEADKAVL
jgi:hypothetical protein